MIRWTDTRSTRRRPDRRDLVAFLVAFVAALVVLGALFLVGAQDADGATVPTPKLTGTAVGGGGKCGPVLVVKTGPNQGTLYGCTDGHVQWWPKRATR